MSFLLETERLLLRPPGAGDVRHFVPLLGDFEVAKNLSRVPYPYTEDDGLSWVVNTADERLRGEDYTYAILRREDLAFLGVCGVHPARGWEFGYWLGRPYWGFGYATEAVGRLATYAFDELGAKELYAGWFVDNPASGRVLDKLGCLPLGLEQRDSLSRDGAVSCNMMVLKRENLVQARNR